MIDSPEKSPHLPLRLLAIALMWAVAFAAIMVPLHRVLHAPPALAQKAQFVERQVQAAEAAQATRGALTRQETGQFSIQDDATRQYVAHQHASHSPFGHQAGQDCDNWNAVFGADTFTTYPLGVIGPDAALTQRIAPPRDAQYARLSATQNLARGPPRC